MIRGLFTNQRQAQSEVLVTLSSNPEFASHCTEIVLAALKSIRSNAVFIKYAIQRFLRASRLIQKFAKRIYSSACAIVARGVESWCAQQADSATVPIAGSVRNEIVWASYRQQRCAFRLMWHNWRKQQLSLEMQFALARSEKNATTNQAIARERIGYLQVRLAQMKIKEPKYDFQVKFDELAARVSAFLRHEALVQMQSVMKNFGVECDDPAFVKQLVDRYQAVVKAKRRHFAHIITPQPPRLTTALPHATAAPGKVNALEIRLPNDAESEAFSAEEEKNERPLLLFPRCRKKSLKTAVVERMHVPTIPSSLFAPIPPKRWANTLAKELCHKVTKSFLPQHSESLRSNRATTLKQKQQRLQKESVKSTLCQVSPPCQSSQRESYHYHRFYRAQRQYQEHRIEEVHPAPTKKRIGSDQSQVKWTNGRVTMNSALEVILSSASLNALSAFVPVEPSGPRSMLSEADIEEMFKTSGPAEKDHHADLRVLPTRVLKGHNSPVMCLAFVGVQNSTFIASGCLDGLLKVWSCDTGECVVSEIHKAHISFILNAERVLCSCAAESVHIMSVDSWHRLQIFSHEASITAAAIHTSYLITSGHDLKVYVWSLERLALQHIFSGHLQSVSKIRSIENMVLTGSHDSTIHVWAFQQPVVDKMVNVKQFLLGTYVEHVSGIFNIISTEHGIVLSVSNDGVARMWNMETFQTLRVLHTQLQRLSCVVALANNRILFCCVEGSSKVLQVNSGRCIAHFKLAEGFISCSAEIPSGDVLCGTTTGDVVVLDSATCSVSGHWGKHLSEINSILVTSDNKWAVTASDDKTISLFFLV